MSNDDDSVCASSPVASFSGKRAQEEQPIDEKSDCASQTCLLCYETDRTAVPLPCCGKEVCARCSRLVRRRAARFAPLCPFCRRPDAKTAAATALRSRLASELSSSRTSIEAKRRVSLTLILAPNLPAALDALAEALVDVAAASPDAGAVGSAVAVALRLCEEWPALAGSGGKISRSCQSFWDDLQVTGTILGCEAWPVANFFATLVSHGVVGSCCEALASFELRRSSTSPAQGRFLVALLHRLLELWGVDRLRASLFDDEPQSKQQDDHEIGTCSAGVFPWDGHPANVRFVRALYEDAGLSWLCEHESFAALAEISDDSDISDTEDKP